MNQYRRLGQLTASKTAAEKKAIVGRAIGTALDNVVGLGGRAVRGLWGQRGIAPKALTLGGLGLGAGAINEGLAYNDMPHLELDNDSLWSPKSQAIRQQMNPSFLGQAKELFKRPIQTLMGNDQVSQDHNDYFRRNPRLPASVISGWKQGPDGKMQMQLSGTVDAPFEQSYLDMLAKHRAMQGMPGMLGRQTGSAAPGSPDKGTVKYIFGHPAVPGSSNF